MGCSGRVADCGCGELPGISAAVFVVWVFVFALLMIVFAMGASALLDTRVASLLDEAGIETLIYAVSPPPSLATPLFWTLIALLVALIGLIVYLRSATRVTP